MASYFLTRAQLSKFITDPQTLKAFEDLLAAVSASIPSDVNAAIMLSESSAVDSLKAGELAKQAVATSLFNEVEVLQHSTDLLAIKAQILEIQKNLVILESMIHQRDNVSEYTRELERRVSNLESVG